MSTDITFQRDEEALLSALVRGRTFWIRRIDTELIGIFSSSGSFKAISDFRRCIQGEEDHVRQMLSE